MSKVLRDNADKEFKLDIKHAIKQAKPKKITNIHIKRLLPHSNRRSRTPIQ